MHSKYSPAKFEYPFILNNQHTKEEKSITMLFSELTVKKIFVERIDD